jgi:hypothetical protein
MLAPPAATAAMPRARSARSENPAVPPPPVGGAAVGYDGPATGDGDGLGLGDGLAPVAAAPVAVPAGDPVVGTGLGVGTPAVVVRVPPEAGDPALAVPLNSAVDEGEALAVDPTVGRGDPEPVQALMAADDTTASRIQPTARYVRTFNEPPHAPGAPQAVLSVSR